MNVLTYSWTFKNWIIFLFMYICSTVIISLVNTQLFKIKLHIFWEGHIMLRNLHLTFDCMYCGQKLGEDFAKLCGLLRIYEPYIKNF